MATEAEVADAITRILKAGNPAWRGNLSQSDFDQLNAIYQRQLGPLGIPTRNAPVEDKLIGALRRQWPAVFPNDQLKPGDAGYTPPALPNTDAPPSNEPTGAAAEAAKKLHAGLAANHNALNDADEELATAILNAETSHQEDKQTLKDLQQEIINEINKRGDALKTPAGQQDFARWLGPKADAIKKLTDQMAENDRGHQQVLKGLADYYAAIGKDKPAEETTEKAGAPPVAAAPSATPASGGLGGGTPPMGGGDASLGGDPLGGLGGALGPAMGALGGLPSALGSMMPMGGSGGGGMPLGDLASSLGSALRDAGGSDKDRAHGGDRDDPDELKDPASHKPSDEATKAAGNEHSDSPPAAGAGDGTTVPAAATGKAPVTPAAATSVELPDGTKRIVASPALAKAGHDVLNGTGIDEAFPAAGLALSPLGSAVTSPVAPSHLQFGDIGEYNDHRVMALGGNKVWNNGQVASLEQLQTGPNFLGWRRVAAPASAGTPPQAALTSAVATPQ